MSPPGSSLRLVTIVLFLSTGSACALIDAMGGPDSDGGAADADLGDGCITLSKVA